MTGDSTKSVSIPADLYKKIEQVVKESADFTSVEGYVTFVLQEVLADDGEQKGAFSKEEEAEVKRRLKALGYLD
jgi:hypothetical protein